MIISVDFIPIMTDYNSMEMNNRQLGGQYGKVSGHLYEEHLTNNPTEISSDVQSVKLITGYVKAIEGNSRPKTESKADALITMNDGSQVLASIKKNGRASAWQIQLSNLSNYANLFNMPENVQKVFRLYLGVGTVKDWDAFVATYGDYKPQDDEEIRLGRLFLSTIEQQEPEAYAEFVSWVNKNSRLIIKTLLSSGMTDEQHATHMFFEEFGMFAIDDVVDKLDGPFIMKKTGSTFNIGGMSFQRYSNGKQADNLQARLSRSDFRKAMNIQ